MEFFITSQGIPVHVSDSGKGEKVFLLLHGYLETLYIWNEFREILPTSFRTIAIDLPGHGLSGSHPECNSMSFCSDVIAEVLTKLGVSQCSVIGHSMGGYVAQACLRHHPEFFSSLINFNSNPYSDDPSKEKERLKEIDFINSGKLSQLSSIAIPNMYAQSNLRSCDDKIQETIEISDTHDISGVAATIRGLMSRPDNILFLSNCDKPILFIFGDHDIHMSLSKAQQILKDIPNAKGAFIPDTGHNSFIERPTLTLESLMNFLTTENC